MKSSWLNTGLLLLIAGGLIVTNVETREARQINRRILDLAANKADEAVKLVKENTGAINALSQKPTYIQPLPNLITVRLQVATVDKDGTLKDVPAPKLAPDGSLFLPFPQDSLPPVRPAEVEEPK